jgi:transketolase
VFSLNKNELLNNYSKLLERAKILLYYKARTMNLQTENLLMTKQNEVHPVDEKIKWLEQRSVLYRRMIIQMIYKSKAGHTGGSLSCVDLLNVLYNHVMNITPENFSEINRDHYIHSKGHSVEALYAVLADKGFYSIKELDTVESYGSEFIGHPTRKVPGIEQNTGALGHGLSVAVGIALAAKLDHRNNRVFTIMGDGELTEGSIWEACVSAAHYQLDNLTAIIDNNTLQITGKTQEVMAMAPLKEKFSAFGFSVREVNGHSIPDLIHLFESLPFEPGKPNLVIAHTTKGKGISYIENQVHWHHRVPNDEEYALALQELNTAEQALQGKAAQ